MLGHPRSPSKHSREDTYFMKEGFVLLLHSVYARSRFFIHDVPPARFSPKVRNTVPRIASRSQLRVVQLLSSLTTLKDLMLQITQKHVALR